MRRGCLTATGAGSHNNSESNRFLSVGRKVTEGLSHPLFEERFLTVVDGFALGYLTAVLLHGRINAYFDTRPGPFQITKPPQGEQHPRGFVQSTVLKTITEHPQGMTTAEIITELRPQGIGQEPIANARPGSPCRPAARSPFSAPNASVISASSTSCNAVRTTALRNSSSSLRRALTSIVPDLPCLLVMVYILAKGSGDCDITRIP